MNSSWHVVEFENQIETDLRDIVSKHHPLDWKEDVITHELLIAMRGHFASITLRGLRHPIDLEWEIYKFHGHRESTFGDIGLLVRYKMPSGHQIEGAGFLEAKARARESAKFNHVRHEQVTRLIDRSPQTRLLLYDYNPVSVLDTDEWAGTDFDEMMFQHRMRHMLMRQSAVTHGPAIPLQLASAINQYDDGLYRFCFSLSYQFTRRYFNLHDLDFREKAIQAVKGCPSDLGAPNYLMVVRASPKGKELPESYQPNENTYEKIE